MTRTDPERMIIGGVEYVTTSGAIKKFATATDERGEPISDVTDVIIRDWKRRRLIHSACDPDGGPIRLDGQNVFPWLEVSDAGFTRWS